ncbi:MAG TPA: class I SAM-dependent methyltransferase [Albidovulum sp.]|uniref:class I SAM-dependent DNA methyltransferase n=1 Tax=Albidovulum sp. TaxID=1872424 RepID=UPI002BE04286|nr:class I SAM-dependent methyltransferase [Albidovulum sp.]
MSVDRATIDAYEANAAAYAKRFRVVRLTRPLKAFIDALPQGARVLDLGCGPGDASAHMRNAGLHPDPVDASPAMVALANDRHRIGARLGTFDELEAVAAYDGVWANFSLLHAPRADLPRHLAAIHRALKPAGLFHIAMKTGAGEVRDRLGRSYTYVTRDELKDMLAAAGFTIIAAANGHERGLAGTLDPFVIFRTRADR